MCIRDSHGTAREVDAVVRKAVELGVPKICVNHPHFLVNATYEQMREWADLGAYLSLIHISLHLACRNPQFLG